MTKYKMPVPPIKQDLIIAFANGAKIQYLFDVAKTWETLSIPSWIDGERYRVDPTCDYALGVISELYDDRTVDVYLNILEGGQAIVKTTQGIKTITLETLGDDPFDNFKDKLNLSQGITSIQKVKKVLWVFVFDEGLEPSCMTFKGVYFSDAINPNETLHNPKGGSWYKIR